MRDRNGLEVLDRDDCLDLLRSQEIGRVGFTSGALPVILPVDYVVVEDRIVFRTSQGSALDRAVRNASVVAFEADNVGQSGGDAWSVVVTGRAAPVDTAAGAALQALGDRWPNDGRYVAVTTELISGRRR